MAAPVNGKCEACRIVWEWKPKPLLRDAACPDCGGVLYQTTHLLRGYRRRHQKALHYLSHAAVQQRAVQNRRRRPV